MRTTSILLLLIGIVCVNSQIGCRDENNNIVDWYYIYKVPKNKFTKNDLIKNGVAYLYITPATLKKGWTMSTISLNDSGSMPGRTLNPLYQNIDSLSVIYNDQPPDEDTKENLSDPKPTEKPSFYSRVVNFFKGRKTRDVDYKKAEVKVESKARIRQTGGGHTKGVLIADSSNGVWLVHSVPKFPPLPNTGNKYSYPATGTKFGQSFLCLTLSGSEMTKVGTQLKYNEPNIIHSNIPSSLASRFSSIVDVVNRKTVKSPPWSNIANITTVGKMGFTSFAKSARFNDDIYEELVAPTFNSDLLVETWRNGRGVLDSECKLKYKVNNIDKIAFTEHNIAFSSHSDHSKWAVSVLNENSDCKRTCKDHWICIGDINRAEAQETRGGGTVCTKNFDLWSLYSKTINAIENCKGDTETYYFVSSYSRH